MSSSIDSPKPLFQRLAQTAMASCLGVMAVAVFVNVVLRYGFGSGIAASEELSRLLFVWMVFIGAAAAYRRLRHARLTRRMRRGKGHPSFARHWPARGLGEIVPHSGSSAQAEAA